MRAPEAGPQWVTTTARSGLRIERTCWAAPFTRRLARRLAISAPAELAGLDALVHDGSRRQWAALRVADGVAAVTDAVAPADTAVVSAAGAVDFAAGTEDHSGAPEGARGVLGAALACPADLDWVAELDHFWRQYGKGSGMPVALDVRDLDGRRHVVGPADSGFQIHADGAVLGRVFSGDMLFDEALFSHLLRIVGGLAEVSVLIGATMREAYGGFEI
ncbi:hypothetical protein [Mycolicibacterium sp.]|uniref:hypothetical protein n=1 Tax=Mycolicibacterium sp. TaxID=2320850 RepID=UPI003D118D20